VLRAAVQHLLDRRYSPEQARSLFNRLCEQVQVIPV
jgi:hypothetical protein